MRPQLLLTSLAALALTFALCSCAPANPNEEQNRLDRERILAQPLPPAARPGIWVDQPVAQAYRASRAVPDDLCREARAQGAPVTQLLLFTGSDAVTFDPFFPERQHDVVFRFRDGRLEPGAAHEKLAHDERRRYEYALFRTAASDVVRLRVHAVDLGTQAAEDTDRLLQRLGEREAREFLAKEYACAGRELPKEPEPAPAPKPEPGGEGTLLVAGAKGNLVDLKLTAPEGRAVSCGFDANGKTFLIGSGKGEIAARTYGMDGILVVLPGGIPAAGPAVLAEIPGDGDSARVELGTTAEPDFVYEGSCKVKLAPDAGRLRFTVRCGDVIRSSSKTPGAERVTVSAELSCRDPRP